MESPFALDGQDDLRMECSLVDSFAAGCSTVGANSAEAEFLRKVGLKSAESLRGLAVLNWQQKGLTPAELAAFARLVAASESVLRDAVELYLGGNAIGDAGASIIAMVVAAAPKLRELELWSCGIGDAGCDALAAALRTGAMPSCEGLCVAGNPFTARGREALLEAAAQGSPGLSVFLE